MVVEYLIYNGNSKTRAALTSVCVCILLHLRIFVFKNVIRAFQGIHIAAMPISSILSKLTLYISQCLVVVGKHVE